jgi:hypothetical protein
VFLGYSEFQLILAEAAVRGWISADTSSCYEKAIKASFEFYNKYAGNYSSYVDETAAETYLQSDSVALNYVSTNEEKIERIIMQKYLQSFLQGGWRMYFDHLRTGYPCFADWGDDTPPTRWMYPNKEYDYNSENVTKAITRQFGEGNDKTREVSWWLK